MKIVLDTNVLVSAVLSPSGTPAEILSLVINEEVILCYDDRVLNEYRGVLGRERFGFDGEAVSALVSFLEQAGERVNATPLSLELPDPDDRVFFEVLESSRADYLVTGNTRHYHSLGDPRIVTPREFMTRYFGRA